MAKAGVFDEIIKKLKEANAKIAESEAIAEKITEENALSVEKKVSAYMDKYNDAINLFVRLPQELERLAKYQKASMWRNKDWVMKQISK